MLCDMASTRATTITGSLLTPLSSGHDRLECGSSKSSPSRQEDSMTTCSKSSVMPSDRQSDVTKDVCVVDVGGVESQNGAMARSPVMTTGGAGSEFPELSAPLTGGSLPSGAETPCSNDSDFVSTVQTLNPKTKLIHCPVLHDDPSPSSPPSSTDLIGQKIIATDPLEENNSSTMSSISNAKSTGGLHPGQLGTRNLGSSNEVQSQPRVSPDLTGTSLEDFIIKTLNKNKSDRTTMLQLEADMTAFINDSGEMWKFPPMSSYHRMLVHRVAAFFGLEHKVDDHGKCVVISRQQNTRIPDFKFRDHLSDDFIPDNQAKKSMQKKDRDYKSLEESLGVDRITLDDRKCKSFEERAEEYKENPNDSRQMQVVNLETQKGDDACRTISFRNGECGSGDPPRKLDPDGRSSGSAQLQVGTSLHKVKKLSNPDAATRTAPDSVTTLPANASAMPDDEAGGDGPSTGSPFFPFPDDSGEPLTIWVASTIGQIPPGSIIINPRKGEPYTNPDGSLYRWYPPSGAMEKKECSFGTPVAPDMEASAVSNEQQHEETRSPKDQSQEEPFVQTSTVSASKIETATTAFAESGNSMNYFPPSSSSTKTQMPPTSFSRVTQPVVQADMTTYGMTESSCHVGQASVFLPAYGAIPNPAPVRFVCPQPVIYPSTVGVLDQQSHVPDGVPYGYIPTYATDSFQATSFPPVAMPLLPTETYQQLPPQLVQYADKTWNQYQQPLAVVPQQGASGGQVYYGVGSAIGSQGGVPSQTHPVQLVFVSSGSSTDLNQSVLFTSQASVMSGGIVGTAQPAYMNIGPQPQYIPYAYRPNQPLSGAVLPFYPNAAVSVPALTSSAPPRGPPPCLVPVVHPSAPVSGRILPNQSPSPQSFQFSVPPPPIIASSLSRTFRPQESTSSPIRADGGRNQAWPVNRPALNPGRPRFGSGRPARGNVAFPPANIGTDDPGYPRLPQNRMVIPPVSSNHNHKPRSTVTSVNITSNVPLSLQLRKTSAVPHPYVDATAKESVLLEVCGVPANMSRQKVNAYLADLASFGAKEFHIRDDPYVKPKDSTCVGSGTIMAVFDSATSAQRALRDHRAPGYHLRTTPHAYNFYRCS